MEKKSTFIVVAVVALAVAGGFWFFQQRTATPQPTPARQTQTQPQRTATPSPQTGTEGSSTEITGTTIAYTDSGYTPKTTKVSVGEMVTFVNESAKSMWPATAVHPTHRVYLGSDITQCGTPEGTMMFDACQNIQPGGSWSFTFNAVGSWQYHDHATPTNIGTVVVE